MRRVASLHRDAAMVQGKATQCTFTRTREVYVLVMGGECDRTRFSVRSQRLNEGGSSPPLSFCPLHHY